MLYGIPYTEKKNITVWLHLFYNKLDYIGNAKFGVFDYIRVFQLLFYHNCGRKYVIQMIGYAIIADYRRISCVFKHIF